jgi:hypothetical protein
MAQLHTIEAFSLDAINDERFESPDASQPLSKEAIDLIMRECPVVVALPLDGSDQLVFTQPRCVADYDPASMRLSRPSTAHQRSFQLHLPKSIAGLQDKYGNTYDAITLKGNNFTEPRAIEHPTAVNQVVAYGLQESKIIGRVMRASEVLRARNIATEWIVGLAEPRQYPYPLAGPTTPAYELLSRAAYTFRIAENYWKALPEDKRDIDTLSATIKQFELMTFYVSMRAMDTAYRLGDLRTGKEALDQFIAEQGDPEAAERGYIENLSNQESKIAINLGVNLARLHIDLKHGFLHTFNITANGGIVDLDSVSGESLELGDDPITNEDRANDVHASIASLIGELRGLIHLVPARSIESAKQFVAAYFKETIKIHSDERAAEILADIALRETSVKCIKTMLVEEYMSQCVDNLPKVEGVGVYDAIANESDEQIFKWLDSDDASAEIYKCLEENVVELLILQENGDLSVDVALGTIIKTELIALFMMKYWLMPAQLARLDPARQAVALEYLANNELPNCYTEKMAQLRERHSQMIQELLASNQIPNTVPFIEGLEYEEIHIYLKPKATTANLAMRVPYDVIAHMLEQHDVVIRDLQDDAATPSISFNIADASFITDIITDGYLDSWLHNIDSDSLVTEFDTMEHKAPTYVLVVSHDGDAGQKISLARVRSAKQEGQPLLTLF